MKSPVAMVLASASLLLASCASAPAPVDSRAPAAAATIAPATQLNKLYEDYFEDLLRLQPLVATFLGDDRYNDRMQNPASPEYQRELSELQRRYLDRARRISPDTLVGSDRISYDVFIAERLQALQGDRFPDWLLPIDQMDSIASTLAVLGSGASAQPFRNASDYEKFLKRAAAFVTWSNSAIVAMREGMRRGVVQPRVAMLKVLPQLREIGVQDPNKSVFWRPIQNFPEAVGAADRARLQAAYADLLGKEVLPAYRRLADFIEQEYLPLARSSVAWTALPDGAAWYDYKLATQTTTRMTADEIHRLGLEEVARIRSEMDIVRGQVEFAGDLAAFFKHLQTDRKFFAADAASLLEAYRALKMRIDGLLPAQFADFPKADYEVRAVEPFRARSAPGASYQPPSADGKRPGIFYINTFNIEAQPLYGMETLSLHEAAPGHHFQVSIQQELTDLPRFRRFGSYTAYAEGWALYCESIGKDLGLFKDPYQWYGRLNDEMLRAMRLVVDTGLHAKGWTREQAIRFMLDNSSMAATDVEAEVERYIVWPGQATAYKVGQLRITAMRASALQLLGGQFDVKAFHSQLLRDGALPLDVLQAKIDRWVQSVSRK